MICKTCPQEADIFVDYCGACRYKILNGEILPIRKASPAPLSPSAARKSEPVHSGVGMYFPRALRAISRVSMKGSAKHNPGEPVRWAKEKSTDHPDCVARHNLTPYSVDEDTGELHIVHAAWRQLAWCETVLEALDKGLVSIEDLESGEVAASELGALIVEDSKK